MGRWIGERDALVLRGDVDELRRQLGELRGRAEPTVQVRPRAPDDCTTRRRTTSSARLEPRSRESCAWLGEPTTLEQRLDLGLLGPRANQIGRCPPAEHQAQRADDNRFAGAGLARQDVEPGLQRQIELFDEDEVFDPELASIPACYT